MYVWSCPLFEHLLTCPATSRERLNTTPNQGGVSKLPASCF